MAHPGGKITSNKDEATAAFLAKKVAAGEELTEAQRAALDELGGAAPEPAPSPFQAYVANLPKATTAEGGLADLRALAEGVVGFVAITDRTTGECRGFGFATLESQARLDAFVAALHEQPGLGSESLAVSVAKKALGPRAKKPAPKPRPPRKPRPAADGDAPEKKDGSFRTRRRGKSNPKHAPSQSKKGEPKAPPPKKDDAAPKPPPAPAA